MHSKFKIVSRINAVDRHQRIMDIEAALEIQNKCPYLFTYYGALEADVSLKIAS